MALDYEKMAATASRLLERSGKTQIIRRTSGAVLDPVGGNDITGTVSDLDCLGHEQSIKISDIDGTNIQSGDRMFVLDNSQVPTVSDALKVGGEYWPIVNVRSVKPASLNLVFFVQVRK